MDTTVLFDLLDPELFRNPYPVYAHLRASAPVYWSEQLQSWVLTRYDDIATLVHDPRMITGWRQLPLGRELTAQEQADIRDMERIRMGMLGSLNGADHQRLRGLAHSAFTPRVVEQMRADIQAQVDALIDALAPRGALDLVRDVGLPLPLAMIFRLIGVPPEAQGAIRAGADALVASASLYNPEPGEIARVARTARAGEQQVRHLIAARRGAPQDDLLTRLVQAEHDGEHLSDDELCSLVYTLLLTGFETIVNLIGNGVLALLTHPDQLARLRAEPALIESAVEELLRYESPAHTLLRRTGEDVQVRDVTIPAGQTVFLLLAAANHDPAQFPEPERLDLGRSPNRHLSFGHGPHFCIGAALARLQGQIAIGTLLRRLPGLRLDIDPEALVWRPTMILRGLQALPLRFDPQV